MKYFLRALAALLATPLFSVSARGELTDSAVSYDKLIATFDRSGTAFPSDLKGAFRAECANSPDVAKDLARNGIADSKLQSGWFLGFNDDPRSLAFRVQRLFIQNDDGSGLQPTDYYLDVRRYWSARRALLDYFNTKGHSQPVYSLGYYGVTFLIDVAKGEWRFETNAFARKAKSGDVLIQVKGKPTFQAPWDGTIEMCRLHRIEGGDLTIFDPDGSIYRAAANDYATQPRSPLRQEDLLGVRVVSCLFSSRARDALNPGFAPGASFLVGAFDSENRAHVGVLTTLDSQTGAPLPCCRVDDAWKTLNKGGKAIEFITRYTQPVQVENAENWSTETIEPDASRAKAVQSFIKLTNGNIMVSIRNEKVLDPILCVVDHEVH